MKEITDDCMKGLRDLEKKNELWLKKRTFSALQKCNTKSEKYF